MNSKPRAARPRSHSFFGAKLRFACFVFAVILLFSGCELYGTAGGDDANIEGALPYMLQGKWAYPPAAPDEVYTITGKKISYASASDSTFGYEGTIEFVSNYSSNSGLVIIRYTVKPAYPAYNLKDYFAIYYRNLNPGWVQLANAAILSSPTSPSPDVGSLDEAKAKFTRMTLGKYVDWGNVMPQRRIQ
jgi:hypothetical protein